MKERTIKYRINGKAPVKVIGKIPVEGGSGVIYYVNDKGDVCRCKLLFKRKSKPKPKVVAKGFVKREKGFGYFVDFEGDVCEYREPKK